MTAIAPTKPQNGHLGARTAQEPAFTLLPRRSAARKGVREADLPAWLNWSPSQPLPPGQIGKLLSEFAADHPQRPLLILSPELQLQPDEARKLAAIAANCSSPVVFSLLSNQDTRLNPFAGLDTSRLDQADRDTRPENHAWASSLVSLLGSGQLHCLEFWPEHAVFFTPAAISILAGEDVTRATALERLNAQQGQLLVSDCLFAESPERRLDYGPKLEPHEQRRPAPWGDLSARLQEWLASDTGFPLPGSAGGEAVSLHITHSWGGGVAQWVSSFIEADTPGRNFQLRSEGPQRRMGTGQRLSLYAGNELATPVGSWWLSPGIQSCEASHQQYAEVLKQVCQRHGIGRIIVSSLVGHSLDAFRTGLPTIQVLHDYFPGWPLLDVHPAPYLPKEKQQRLHKALERHPLLEDFRNHDATAWILLADQWRETLAENDIRLVAPSQCVADMCRQLDAGWEKLDIAIIQHGLPPLVAEQAIEPRARMDGKLRLVIPGRMLEGKGQALLLEALPQITPFAQVYLLGAGKQGEVFFGQAGVNVILQYQRSELPKLLSSIGPHAAALLSVVPETFSYTLSEMRHLRIPVIATRLGSFAERIKHGQDGILIDANADAFVQVVQKLAAQPEVLQSIRKELRTAEAFTTTAMVSDYDTLCPARLMSPEITATASLGDLQRAALAEQEARLQMKNTQLNQQVVELQREVEQRTEWARERQHTLQKEQQERRVWVEALEAEIQSGIQGLKREQEAHGETHERFAQLRHQHDTVLQSSSWRLTKPLRASRRILSNLKQVRAWNPLRWPLLLSQVVRTVSTQGLAGAAHRLQTSPHRWSQPKPDRGKILEPIGNPEPPASMPRAPQPVVSIIIPVYNKWEYTAACLRSLAETRCAAGFEVIVVDDGSTDETALRMQGVEGVEYIRNPSNVGFVGSCNRGAQVATGEYILLLNNDTQVQNGWLDALLQTFIQFPDTGMAGARLIYPDGSLQEAGGIIFRDGSGWNYGRGDLAERPEYCFTREVDYCSGACIILPSSLFQQLGGLDQRYAPAYYEDTDLAFQVREAGYKVRIQANSTIIHHEGITSGTDLNSGAKRYQEVNRKKFLERWKQELAAFPNPIANPDRSDEIRRARDHRLRGRVLVIDAYTPEPDQDSGSLRLKYLFDCFQQLGYGVTFFADNRAFAGQYSADLQNAGVEVLFNPWIESLQDFFNERGDEFDFILISRHYVAVNYIAMIRKYCPKARFIFDTVDLHYLREQRLAELEDSLPLRRVAAQTRRSELAVIAQADATLVVSPVEQEVLSRDAPAASVHILSNIHRVTGSQRDFADRKDIFFVGGYQHPPNIDAVQWFASSVWPLIHAQIPDMQFHIIGSKAPEKIRTLSGDGIVFHGFVKQLEPWLDGCRLSVAPLRYGAGVKGKVNLSMSHGQPVVATPMAVEGLFAVSGKDVLVAEAAEDFAAAVVRLYQDEDLWRQISSGGLENVRKYFSQERAINDLQDVLTSTESN